MRLPPSAACTAEGGDRFRQDSAARSVLNRRQCTGVGGAHANCRGLRRTSPAGFTLRHPGGGMTAQVAHRQFLIKAAIATEQPDAYRVNAAFQQPPANEGGQRQCRECSADGAAFAPAGLPKCPYSATA